MFIYFEAVLYFLCNLQNGRPARSGLTGAVELEHQDQVEMLPLVNIASMQTAQPEVPGLLQKFKVSSHVYRI